MTPAENNLRLVPDEPFDEAAPPAYDIDPFTGAVPSAVTWYGADPVFPA